VRWQKTALLVFSALARVSAKTKCAVCAAGFSACLQLPIKRSIVCVIRFKFPDNTTFVIFLNF
jgi:hypothetical protein